MLTQENLERETDELVQFVFGHYVDESGEVVYLYEDRPYESWGQWYEKNYKPFTMKVVINE